jgi:hypothetical protein
MSCLSLSPSPQETDDKNTRRRWRVSDNNVSREKSQWFLWSQPTFYERSRETWSKIDDNKNCIIFPCIAFELWFLFPKLKSNTRKTPDLKSV